LLAVRAARRALAANPDDANAYLRLGQAYLALWEKTGERPLSRADAPLQDLRHVQTVTALEQAVLRDPDCEPAHRLLGRLSVQHSYLDAALDHRREELRLAHRAGPRQAEEAEEFSQRLRRLEKQTQDLQRIVAEKQRAFDASDRGNANDPASRAQAALDLGLARRALEDILSPASPVLLESSGLQLELQLLLRLGRAEQLRDFMLDPKEERDKANLGFLELPAPPVPGYPLFYRLPAYSWLRLCWTAAVGDYGPFEDQLRDLLEQLDSRQREQSRLLRRALALALPTEIALSAQPETLLLRPAAHDARLLTMQSFLRTSSFRGDQADLLVLGGLVALERGLPQLAVRHLEQARKIYPIEENTSQEYATQALADAYWRRLHAAARDGKKP
jgi:hypothetical protein